jgi:hypothetical protein
MADEQTGATQDEGRRQLSDLEREKQAALAQTRQEKTMTMRRRELPSRGAGAAIKKVSPSPEEAPSAEQVVQVVQEVPEDSDKYVKVPDGYIQKSYFDNLPWSSQKFLTQHGADAYNKAVSNMLVREDIQKFDPRTLMQEPGKDETVKLPDGYVQKSYFDTLPINTQEYLTKYGVKAYQDALTEPQYVRIWLGPWQPDANILKFEYDQLSDEEKKYLGTGYYSFKMKYPDRPLQTFDIPKVYVPNAGVLPNIPPGPTGSYYEGYLIQKAKSGTIADKANLAAWQASMKALHEGAKMPQAWDVAAKTYKKVIDANFEKDNVKLDTGEWVSKDDFSKLSPANQGLLQSGGVDAFNKKFEAESVKVQDGYISLTDYNALSPTDQALIKQMGVDAFNKQKQEEYRQSLVKQYGSAGFAVLSPEGQQAFKGVLKAGGMGTEAITEAIKAATLATAETAFAKDNVKITAAGEAIYLSKDYYNALSPDDQELLKEVGFDKFQATIQDRLAGLKNYIVTIPPSMTAEEIQKSTLLTDKTKAITLALYYPEAYKKWSAKTGVSLKSLGIDESLLKAAKTIDMAGFLRDNPDAVPTLIAAGYNHEDIDKAVEYNKQPFIMANPIEAYNKALKDAGYYKIKGGKERETFLSSHPELQSLKEKADAWLREAPKAVPDLSLQAFTANYLITRGIDPKKVDDIVLPSSEISKLRGEAGEVYARLYGVGAREVSRGVQVMSMALFSPARVLYPEVTAKEISGLEWGIGVAQLAFVATGVGGMAARGLSIPAMTMLRSTQFAASAFLTPIGVLGTVANWKDMSPPERGVSVAFDIIVALPLVMGGFSAAKAVARKVDPLGTAARDLIKAENTTSRAFTKSLKDAYGQEVADKFRAVNKAQADYIDKLVKLEKLESSKVSDATKIKTARHIAEASERRLQGVATEYAKSLKTATTEISTGKYQLVRVTDKAGNLVKYERVPAPKGKVEVGVGFDSPTVARMLDDLPREIGRNARSMVKSLRPTEVEIARLRADVTRTEARLKEAQEKFPTDPSKWSDLIYDHAIAQSKLAQAQMGNVVKVQAELLKLRGQLPKASGAEAEQLASLERRLKIATSGAEITKIETQISELSIKIYNLRLSKAPAGLRNQIYRLEAELTKTIKGMEVEWGRGGPITRGRPKVSVGAPPTTGGGAVATGVLAGTENMIAREMASRGLRGDSILDARAVHTPWGSFGLIVPRTPETPAVGTPITKPSLPDIIITEPHLTVKTKTIPRPGVEPVVEPEVEPAVWPIHPPIRIRPYPKIEPYVWPLPEAEPFTKGIEFVEKPQVSPATRVALKAAQEKANAQFLTEVKTATKSAVRTATRLALAGETSTAIKNAVATSVKQQVQNLVKVQPALATQLQTQIQPITKLAVQVAEKVAPKLVTKIKPWTPIRITLPSGEEHGLTEGERAGAVGWKQGFIYKLWFPPYGQNDIGNTRKPIPGVPYYSGPESAYRSIVRLGGKVPSEIKRDMGIVDVVVTTPNEGKPKLSFRPDRYQRTQLAPKTKRTKRSRRKPRQAENESILMSAR